VDIKKAKGAVSMGRRKVYVKEMWLKYPANVQPKKKKCGLLEKYHLKTFLVGSKDGLQMKYRSKRSVKKKGEASRPEEAGGHLRVLNA